MEEHGRQPRPQVSERKPYRAWAVAPGDRVQHFYMQGGAAMTWALCNKQCIVDSLSPHAGFGFCKKCWQRYRADLEQ